MKIVLFCPNNPDHYMGMLAQHKDALAQNMAAIEAGKPNPEYAVRVSCDRWVGIIVATHPERAAFSVLVTHGSKV